MLYSCPEMLQQAGWLVLLACGQARPRALPAPSPGAACSSCGQLLSLADRGSRLLACQSKALVDAEGCSVSVVRHAKGQGLPGRLPSASGQSLHAWTHSGPFCATR